MIFTSESGLTDASRIAEWDAWYPSHLAAMVAVPGIASAQRFRALDKGPPPSLAMYTVASPAVFDSEVYLKTRGMGPFVPVVDPALHRRNLFEGLDAAPAAPSGSILVVADRAAPEPAADGIVWLRCVGIDRSTPYRGIAVFPDIARARAAADGLGGAACYAPLTERITRVNHLGQPVGAPVTGWTPPPLPPRTAMAGHFCTVEPLYPESHAAQLFVAYAEDIEGRMWSYLPRGPYASLDEFRAYADAACKTDDPLVHTIIDNATGEAVGTASYMRIEPAVGVIEIGSITYSPRLQRRPAATEAMYLMMRRVFDELGYRRYEWKCDSLNQPSRNAAQRFGFRYEGLFRQASITRGGNRDTTWFSVIDSEWPVLRTAFERWLDPANFDSDGQQRRSLSSLRDA
jgi:RimJ/RimL family protein N-acetyltransferase